MTDYNDGEWHLWKGGECPVHPETIIHAVYENGFTLWDDKAGGPRAIRWMHNGGEGSKKIVAFRVIEPFQEPRVIWVNEYPDGGIAHYTEEGARNVAGPDATRVAVRYVETPE